LSPRSSQNETLTVRTVRVSSRAWEREPAARDIEPRSAGGRSRDFEFALRCIDAQRHRTRNQLAQQRRLDRLGAARDEHLAEFGGGFVAQPRLLAFEFTLLFAQFEERFARSRCGLGQG
jgi:hypothetical protein